MNVRLISVLTLSMIPLLAQTNPVTVDQVVVLQANMNSLNENPPVTASTASGIARITIRFQGSGTGQVTNPPTNAVTGITTSVSRASVTISLQPTSDTSENITLAHIHRGAAGVNGPVVIDFALSSTPLSSGQTASINKVLDITDATQLSVLREIVNNPAAFYVNMHTTSNPGGFMRGQLRRANESADDFVTGRTDLMTRLLVRIAYQEGVITLAERDAYLATLPPAPVVASTNP